ncbi:hypothetical protein AMTRI_Chr08g161950 [Amborella trichopoda]
MRSSVRPPTKVMASINMAGLVFQMPSSSETEHASSHIPAANEPSCSFSIEGAACIFISVLFLSFRFSLFLFVLVDCFVTLSWISKPSDCNNPCLLRKWFVPALSRFTSYKGVTVNFGRWM